MQKQILKREVQAPVTRQERMTADELALRISFSFVLGLATPVIYIVLNSLL